MISKDEVRYIAHLSRIYLDDQEIDRLSKNLEDILHYIDKLSKLNVDPVKPTSHVLNLQNVYRKDTAKPSLNQAAVMTMARSSANGSFKVPQVIE